MKYIFLLTAVAATIALPGKAADISGTWTVNGDVAGNALNMKCAFTQAADKLTGTCTGAELGSTPATGSVTAGKVSFSHSVQADRLYELTYTGTLNATETSMKGDIAVAGVSGTFSATKDAATPPSPDREFAGNWTIDGSVVGNAISMKCTFKRDGGKLAGTCNYQGIGDSPTTGTVAGDQVIFQNQVQRDTVYDLTYSGKLDTAGYSIDGEIAVAGVTGTFTGSKDK